MGAARTTGTNLTAVMRPEEAWNIDTKLDDGKPNQGKIRSMAHGTMPNCTISNTAYELDYQGIGCNLIFITGY